MSELRLPLRALLLLAQRDVQQVLEYLATPEARRVAPDAPAAVLATIGRLKLSVPVTFDLVGQAIARDGTEPGADAQPAAGNPRPDGRVTRPVRQPEGAELLVATPGICSHREPMGTVEVEFITCPKQYQ